MKVLLLKSYSEFKIDSLLISDICLISDIKYSFIIDFTAIKNSSPISSYLSLVIPIRFSKYWKTIEKIMVKSVTYSLSNQCPVVIELLTLLKTWSWIFSPSFLLTLTTVRNEIEWGDRHDNQTYNEVGHGEAHDEHVGDWLEPLLSPDGVQHHPIAHCCQATQQKQGQAQQ